MQEIFVVLSCCSHSASIFFYMEVFVTQGYFHKLMMILVEVTNEADYS